MHYYLTFAALIPAAALLLRIYRLDRIEKEPRKLLGKLVAFGALAALGAGLTQLLLTRLLRRVLTPGTPVYLLLENFLLIALIEELAKLLPVRLCAWKDPAFDYRFDAVVYAAVSALGFAAVENVLYVLQADLKTAVSRALLSVPGHFFFAVSMGLLLSRAKQAERAGHLRRSRALRAAALALPALLHGIWDLCLAAKTVAAAIMFYGFVAAFFAVSVFFLRRAARTDAKL